MQKDHKVQGSTENKTEIKTYSLDNMVKKMNVKSEFNIKRGKGLLAREKYERPSCLL